MNKIVARKKVIYMEMPSGHYARSEGNLECTIEYIYELPGKNWRFTQLRHEGSIPIELKNGELIGFATRHYFIVGDKIYNTEEKAMCDPLYHPSDVGIVPKEEIEEEISRQLSSIEDDCYGD